MKKRRYVNIRIKEDTYQKIQKNRRKRYVLDIIEEAINNYFA